MSGFNGNPESAAQALRHKFATWLDNHAQKGVADQKREELFTRFETALVEALAMTGKQPPYIERPDPIEQRSAAENKTSNSRSVTWIAGIVAVAFLAAAAWVARGMFGTETQNSNLLFQLDKTAALTAPNAESLFLWNDSASALIVTSTAIDPISAGQTGGMFVTLPEDIEAAASGQTIQITINAQKPDESAAEEFAVAYSTAAVGNSGWQKFPLESQSAEFSFTYDVPAHPQNTPRQSDYLGIWADTSGTGKGVQINELTVRLVVDEPTDE